MSVTTQGGSGRQFVTGHDDCLPVLDDRLRVLDDRFRVLDDSGKGQHTETSKKMII